MNAEEKCFHRELGNKIAETREAAGLTQEALAEKIGIQSNSVHRYEAAERKISLFTAVKLAQALKVSVGELIPEGYIEKNEKSEIEKEAENAFHQLPLECQQMLLKQIKGFLILSA